MIERPKRLIHRLMRDAILAELPENATAKDALNYLIDDDSDYVVYRYDSSERTIFNRINLLWVWPLFILSIPLQWLFTGSYGIKRHTTMGRILHKLVNIEP